MKFIDEVNINVTSGKGGPGCVSFRRESKIPRGGPDGGDGGHGGRVIFKSNPRLHSLLDLHYKRKYSAGNGLPGEGQNRTGSDGNDLVIEVPPGTLVSNIQSKVIADLDANKEVVVLQGGRGGKGNTFFKSSINQAPEHAQSGEEGLELDLQVRLKLIADVGIIGLPNAGKSTFIAAVSAAKPKIADYPFTTLIPNLGVVKVDEEKTMVFADIPGLVPEAHKGVGLGHKFLKHIERTKVFLHLVDVTEMENINPLEDYKKIIHELAAYDQMHVSEESYRPLADRQQIIVLTKVDTCSQEHLDEIQQQFKEAGHSCFAVSAVGRKGLNEVLYAAASTVFAEPEIM